MNLPRDTACPKCLSLDVRIVHAKGKCAYCGLRWASTDETFRQPIGPDDSLLAYEAMCKAMARADAKRRRALERGVA